MTDSERLQLIDKVFHTDAASEFDFAIMEDAQGRKVSPRELGLARALERIYTIVHPRFSECTHEDWEEENEREFNMMGK